MATETRSAAAWIRRRTSRTSCIGFRQSSVAESFFLSQAASSRKCLHSPRRWFDPGLLASRESQDLCFVEGSFSEEARRRLSCVPGDVVLMTGTVVGQHTGLASYTVGQRSGLGISAASRLYVVEKRHADNQLIVGPRSACMRSVFEAVDLKWQHIPTSKALRFSANVVTRYRSKPVNGCIDRVSEDRSLRPSSRITVRGYSGTSGCLL